MGTAAFHAYNAGAIFDEVLALRRSRLLKPARIVKGRDKIKGK